MRRFFPHFFLALPYFNCCKSISITGYCFRVGLSHDTMVMLALIFLCFLTACGRLLSLFYHLWLLSHHLFLIFMCSTIMVLMFLSLPFSSLINFSIFRRLDCGLTSTPVMLIFMLHFTAFKMPLSFSYVHFQFTLTLASKPIFIP